MTAMMQEPLFFYGVAFVLFLALAYAYGRKPLLGWLDAEIAKIRNELDQAQQLRAEAETALADCKKKQAEAEIEAKAILELAHHQAETMRQQAELDLQETLRRHEKMAADRIDLAQAEALTAVRTAAADLAIALARKNLTENITDADAAKLVDQAIADIAGLKKSTARAA